MYNAASTDESSGLSESESEMTIALDLQIDLPTDGKKQ
jgi:hypothetical protein